MLRPDLVDVRRLRLADERDRDRPARGSDSLLLGGMGGFLVIALAVPDGLRSERRSRSGIGYLVVVLLHSGMFCEAPRSRRCRQSCGSPPSTSRRRSWSWSAAPLGGDAQGRLWALAALLLWVTPWVTSTEGFVVGGSHFVERHGLVVIVALGESVVVIGAGATGRRSGCRHRPGRAARARAQRGALVGCTSATRKQSRRR